MKIYHLELVLNEKMMSDIEMVYVSAEENVEHILEEN